MRVVRCRVDPRGRASGPPSPPIAPGPPPAGQTSARPAGNAVPSRGGDGIVRTRLPPAETAVRLSSGQFLGYRGRSSGQMGVAPNPACPRRFASRTTKKGGPGLGAAKGREESRGSPRWRPSSRASVAQLTSGASDRRGHRLARSRVWTGRRLDRRRRRRARIRSRHRVLLSHLLPSLTPDLLVLATKQLRKLLGALLGVRPGEDHHVHSRRRRRCLFPPRATPAGWLRDHGRCELRPSRAPPYLSPPPRSPGCRGSVLPLSDAAPVRSRP